MPYFAERYLKNPYRGVSLSGNASFLMLCGVMLISVAAWAYILPSIFFLCGICMSGWMMAAAVLMSAATVYVASRDGAIAWKVLGASLLFLLVAIAVCIAVEDVSYDGNAYHQEAVALMVSGWNPYREASGDLFALWIDHYGIALETAEAALVSLIGRIEAGKAINWCIILGAALLAGGLIRHIYPRVSPSRLWILIGVIMLNPIGVLQALTFLIDYTKYYYIVVLICCMIGMSKWPQHRSLLFYLAVLVTILAIGTKFNIFFEAGLTLLLGLLWTLCRREKKLSLRIFLIGVISFAIGAIVIGWHPYITNYLTAGHPLYPLMGEGSVDIMSGNTPDMYKTHGRVFNFFYSMLIPGKVGGGHERVNGFTMFFFPLLAVTIAIWLYNIKRWPKVISYIVVCTLASCFIFEQTWWARYIVQLWLVPAVIIVALMAEGSRHGKLLGRISVVMVALCTLWCFSWQPFMQLKYNVMRRHLYEAGERLGKLKMVNTPLAAARMHFEERGIAIIPVSPEEVDPEGTLCYYYISGSVNTFPMIETGKEDVEDFINRMGRYHLKYRDWVMAEADWKLWIEG